MKSKINKIVMAGLFIALVYLATAFIRIPYPDATGAGQIHTGTAVVFIISVVFGPKMGAVSSLGMVLFNLTSPLVLWAPINVIVRPVMALIFGSISHLRGAGGRKIWLNAVAAVAGGVWLVPAMLFGQMLVFQLPLAACILPGVPNNSLQIVLALMLGLPSIKAINLHLKRF